MISLENVGYRYPEGTEALRGLSLEIPDGQFWALLGANGCGKTTLFRILVGLLKPTTGRALIDGQDIHRIKDRELFSRINMVFQDPNDQLFAATVAQDVGFGPTNLSLTPESVRERVEAAIASAGITELADRPVHTLSFGQKRRAALAGVLAMAPKTILLDEPTSGLDPRGVYAIMNLMRRINREQETGFIVATHDVDLVPLFCDRVTIMKQGELVTTGPPEEVFQDPSLVRTAGLRLPRIAHLMEILAREDGVSFAGNRPLTIAAARRELMTVFERTASRRQEDS